MTTKFNSWDQYFMTLTYVVAMKSKDERTKIGALIVGADHEIMSTGFNGIPRGVYDDVKLVQKRRTEQLPFLPLLKYMDRHERPEKYNWYEHAERNAIYNAARMGLSTLKTTMYTNGVPCVDCARGIIQAGINRVIVHQQWEDRGKYIENKKWRESSERTNEMFEEAMVELKFLSEKIVDKITGLSDGNVIELGD